MLQNCCLNAFCASEPLHDTGILVSNIALNHVFNCFNLVKSVVQAHYLTDQLSALWHQAVMDGLIHSLETVAESLLHIADTMKLCIVWSHDCAVVADQLFACVAEVAQGLVVQHAHLALGYMRIQNRLRSKWALSCSESGMKSVSCSCHRLLAIGRHCWHCRGGVTKLALAHVRHVIDV